MAIEMPPAPVPQPRVDVLDPSRAVVVCSGTALLDAAVGLLFHPGVRDKQSWGMSDDGP